MDILAHALWALILGKLVSRLLGKKVNLRWISFWGVFPDIFAFSLYTIFSLVNSGGFHPPHTLAAATPETLEIIQISNLLYQSSHSLIILVVLFFLVWEIRILMQETTPRTISPTKKQFLKPSPLSSFPAILLGWGLHILMDIPTHSKTFYPTPFLWPFLDWTFDGISWGQPWFMIVNYSLIIFLLWWLWREK